MASQCYNLHLFNKRGVDYLFVNLLVICDCLLMFFGLFFFLFVISCNLECPLYKFPYTFIFVSGLFILFQALILYCFNN